MAYKIATIMVVFDGPPGHESGRFVEVEDEQGHGINIGEWEKREDGYYALKLQVVIQVKEK